LISRPTWLWRQLACDPWLGKSKAKSTSPGDLVLAPWPWERSLRTEHINGSLSNLSKGTLDHQRRHWAKGLQQVRNLTPHWGSPVTSRGGSIESPATSILFKLHEPPQSF
jgi:hypothetical protein